jgi:hypothetical protein
LKVTPINPPTFLGRENVGTMKPSLPLGLAYVAAAACAAGHDVTVVDAIALTPHETWRDERMVRIGARHRKLSIEFPQILRS